MKNESSNTVVENFVGMIREIVRDVLKESQLNVEKCYNGIVTAIDVSNNTATVDIGFLVLDNIPNKTGIALDDGLFIKDAVRVYSSSNTLTDAYVGIKLN